jgi:chromosome segregation ATPase
MMKAIIGTLSGIALIAFTYLCTTLAFAVRVNSKHTAELLMDLSDTSVELSKAVGKMNSKGGTIQILDEDLVRVKDTITLSQATLFKEQKSLDQWNSEIGMTLANVNQTVADVDVSQKDISLNTVATLQATTNTIAATEVTIKDLQIQVDNEIDAVHAVTLSANDLLADPAIKETIQHTDQTMANVQDTTKDVSHEVHKYVYPGPWQKVWGFVSGAGLDIGKFFIP